MGIYRKNNRLNNSPRRKVSVALETKNLTEKYKAMIYLRLKIHNRVVLVEMVKIEDREERLARTKNTSDPDYHRLFSAEIMNLFYERNS